MLTIRPPARVSAILARHGRDESQMDRALHGATVRSVLEMGLPSIASFLLLTVYDLVDIFWLAKLGEAPVAAVTVFTAFQWVVSFLNQVIGSGSVTIISRRFGAGQLERTESAIKTTFVGKFLAGAISGAIGLLACRWALGFLGATPPVVELGVDYGRIQLAVLPISLASFSVYTAFRGIGRPRYGMWVSVAGAAVNLVADPLLIFGVGPFPELGIVGASIASALGFLTVTAWGCFALSLPGSPVRVRWFSGPPASLEDLRRIGKIGFPSALESLSFALFSSVLVKLVAIYGTTTVALFGMSRKVLQFGHMLIAGLGLGSGALVGQHLGAGRLERAWATMVVTVQLSTLTLLTFASVVALFADPIVALFFPDVTHRPEGMRYLRLLALGLPFVGMWAGAEQSFAGAGRTVPPLIAQTANHWLITVPLMYALGEIAGFGPSGMMLGLAIGQLIGAVIAFGMVRRGTWLVHEVAG
ncbi:MAG: MATE family efflux transporter [Gemmatimonadetes bacterium]|nr:MATE family efflux transporter [Gemmatimonadota bacterium]